MGTSCGTDDTWKEGAGTVTILAHAQAHPETPNS